MSEITNNLSYKDNKLHLGDEVVMKKVSGATVNVGDDKGTIDIDANLDVNGTVEMPTSEQSSINNPEYLTVTTDSDSKILQGIKSDGTSYIGGDLQVEGQIINPSFQEQIDSAVESMRQTITDSFSNIDNIVNNPDNTTPHGYLSEQNNPEWLQVTTDSEGRVLGGRKTDGTVMENVGIEVNEVRADSVDVGALNVDGNTLLNNVVVKGSVTYNHLPNQLIEYVNDVVGVGKNLFHYDSTLNADSYILSPFNTDNLIKAIFKVARSTEAATFNSSFNFKQVKLVNKNTSDETLVHYCDDDVAPVYYDGTYIGANHGCDDMRKCKCTGHDKTYADIGSIWSCDGNNYTIVRIDIDYIYLLGENTAEYPIFSMRTAPIGTYTHVSGATNTSSFTVTTSDLSQMHNQTRPNSLSINADGNQITSSGDYYFNELRICETYDIPNPADILTEIQRKVGTFTSNPVFTALDNLNVVARHSNTYIFHSADKWTMCVSLTAMQNINLNYFGFTQQGPLEGQYIYMYIPKALPISNGETTLDFRTIVPYNSVPQVMDIISSYWENPNLPPDRWLQMSENIGLASGYLFDYGVGGNKRKDSIYKAFYLYTSRKIYPYGIDRKITMNAGDTKSAVVFRDYIDKNNLNTSGVICKNLVEYNDCLYIYTDFNNTGTFEVEIPSKYTGKDIEVFERSSNVALLNDVSASRILIKVETASPMYGYLVAKINL